MLFNLLITWLSVILFQVFNLVDIFADTIFQKGAGWRPKVSIASLSTLFIISWVKSTFVTSFSGFPFLILCAHILPCSSFSIIEPSFLNILICSEHTEFFHNFWYSYIELPACRCSFNWNNIHHSSYYSWCHNHHCFLLLLMMLPLPPPLMLAPLLSRMLLSVLPSPLVPFRLIVAYPTSRMKFQNWNSI